MTVKIEAPSTGYRQSNNRFKEKDPNMASTRTRLPLQPRKTSATSTTSLSCSDEYGSSGSNLNSKRSWPLEDSSHNDNNKRISSFGRDCLLRRSNEVDNSNSSTLAQTGAPTFPPTAPSKRVSKPKFRRDDSDSYSTSKSSSRNQKADYDTVTIEEKRRKLNGEGYTIHRYLRGRLLGKGGFAKVYHCTALDTNKAYAVKIVPKSNLVKPRAKQKLQAEIKIHRTLKHRHICEYKHFFEDKTNCYILLELCHKQSMNELMKRRKRLTEPEAAYFMSQLIEAVRYMHDQRVIHRDLKLGNLFLDKNLHIKVGDLGLATRLESSEEKRKTICGTPNYIAPEVIQGSKETRGHSFEVDIWSMGVILFTVLVGKPPYEAKDVKATYQRIIANQYSFPNNVRISDNVRELITSMLQSKPHMRPTLDEIEDHAFFTSNGFVVPDSLPLNATHVRPQWREDEFGNLVAANANDDENANQLSRKKSQTSLSGGSTRRQPFASKDPNAVASDKHSKTHALPKSERDGGKGGLNLRNALGAASSLAKPLSSAGFKIFDETESTSEKESKSGSPEKPPLSRSSQRSDGMSELAAKASALSLNSKPGEGTEAGKDSASQQSHDSKPQKGPVDDDLQVLHSILDNLNDVLDRGEAHSNCLLKSPVAKPLSHGGPSRWVTRYVDYTSKYGLGFLLNDGSSGVYFNDSTKVVLESEGETFQYIERRKVQADSTDPGVVRRTEPQCETHSLSSYPERLQKKTTLLKHFRNYLVDHQKRAEEKGEDFGSSTSFEGDAFVYIKKWIRTKHAILFRLSDQTIQIIFYDQTEVLLTPNESYITYLDKKRVRSTYQFNDELLACNTELAKRLKYAKEILNQLAVGQRR